MTQILKAKPVTESIHERSKKAALQFKAKTGRLPTLATVLVGEDPASQVYVRKKGETCHALGIGHQDYKLPSGVSQDELSNLIKKLNSDDGVDGILVQSPLPKGLSERAIFDLINPMKDVDCFSPHNVGLLSQARGTLLPCTPAGVMEILKHYKIQVAGKNALVVGRSDIVGKPMAFLLLHANATVTIAHSKTDNLAEHISKADIVVAAVGRSKFLGASLPWKASATVIDVGINRGEDGTLSGDVDYLNVSSKVAAITPVPGGVGPMTIAMLMVNTLRAAFTRKQLPDEI